MANITYNPLLCTVILISSQAKKVYSVVEDNGVTETGAEEEHLSRREGEAATKRSAGKGTGKANPPAKRPEREVKDIIPGDIW